MDLYYLVWQLIRRHSTHISAVTLWLVSNLEGSSTRLTESTFYSNILVGAKFMGVRQGLVGNLEASWQ